MWASRCGKTSSIIAAIREVQKNDKSLIPILIKATTLDFHVQDDEKTNPDKLLHALIRFLRKETHLNKLGGSTIQKRAEQLYNRTLASKIYAESKLVITNTTKKVVGIKCMLTSVLVAGGALSIAFENMMGVPLLLAAAVSPYMVDVTYKVVSKYFTSSYYRYDYGFAEKMHEFEELMEECSKTHKVLFVLDEFDKVLNMYDMIHPLKMLINQGHALFIVVTSPDMIGKFTERRSREYTLFSQVLFVKRPLFREMEKYIDSIVHEINDWADKREYRNFRNYLCYKSQTDFFDIKRSVRDYIVRIDSGTPIVKIDLNVDQIMQANLQKSIGWIYEKKKRTVLSEQSSNDEMLDDLYSAVERMQNSGEIIIDSNENAIQYPSDSVKYSARNLSTVRDLFRMLAKQGYLLARDDDHYQILGNLPEFDEKVSI